MDKKILKVLAEVCRGLAEYSKNKKFEEPKITKERCSRCGHTKTIVRKYKKHIDFSKVFLNKAKIFENLARREK